MKKVDLKAVSLQLWKMANIPGNLWSSFLDTDSLDQKDFSDPTLIPLQAPWFEQFITHPQINFWITNAIYFYYLCKASGNPQLDAGLHLQPLHSNLARALVREKRFVKGKFTIQH